MREVRVNVVFLGVTGSGKSTVAEKVSEELGLPYISSGVIAREMAEMDPQTRHALNAGLLAPENAMRDMVRDKVEAAAKMEGGFVLDGFPRSLAQYIALQSWTTGVPSSYVWIDCAYTEAIARLLARGRPDDNPDSIARKMQDFEANIYWLGDMIGDNCYTVDSTNLTVNAVTDSVLEHLR